MLEILLAKKTSLDSINVDQISFITNLIRGYDESKLIDIETIKDKSYLHNTLLTKVEIIFLDSKKILLKDQEGVLLNAMQLYNYRNRIIRLFETKNSKPSMHAPDANLMEQKNQNRKLKKV